MLESNSLPVWDMDVIFPGVDSAAYLQEVAGAFSAMDALEADFDLWGIRTDGNADLDRLEPALRSVNRLIERMETLSTYVSCLLSTDTRNEAYKAADSNLDLGLARLRKLLKRFAGWTAKLDLAAIGESSEYLQLHLYPLVRAQTIAAHLLSSAEENLASDMELTGSIAWGKLYNSVTSQIEVTVDLNEGTQTLPMSSVRAMSSHPDRSVRQRAYLAEMAAWKQNEVPIAAALNSIKGESVSLSAKRGWTSPQEEACFGSNIDLATLDAMMTAAEEAFPDFRRYLSAKANALGLSKLAFFDLFAPLPGAEREWTWESAKEFVAEQFDRYTSKLGDYARRSYAENWIDVGPRPGKVDGAYCAAVHGDVSRILLNFKPSFDSVRTLAHELGHGYHNLCLAERTGLQREIPNTLAETASIFCETIVKKAVLAHGEPAERLAVLESALCGACQVVVDISSRYKFESSFFDQRKHRELAPREICELMLKAQLETYGEGLESDQLHSYMWAAKPHYYGASFYNFPYMFGLLFGLGLYSQYEKDPEGFRSKYDLLLSQTGMADAATLAEGFGFDLRTPDFWRGSFDQIRADIHAFEQLV